MILYVIFGTLLHECGHILIAKVLGYRTVLHYGSMDAYLPNGHLVTDKTDNFYITLGGNIMLDLLSLFFLALLYFKRNRLPQWLFWLSVFFAMLIYRHLLLTFICIIRTIIEHRPMTYGNDETEIATDLFISNSVIGVPLFIVSLFSLYILFFKVIDGKIRNTFFLAMVIGGAIGYVLWLSYLGPLLMS